MQVADRDNTVGFIGLGQMGSGMAANIIKGGFQLVAYDIDKHSLERIVALGGQAAESPADVAKRASRVISMVSTSAQAEAVIVGKNGLIEAVQPGDVIVSMSTIDPQALRNMHGPLSEKGVDLIDAGVSGMDTGARDGTLKAFIGGSETALEKVRSVLETMTSEITYFGAIGQGVVMKLVNNMLTQVSRVVMAEALVFGAKAGLDPKKMFDTITQSTGNSVAFQAFAPRMLSRDFEGCPMDIAYKDMEIQTAVGKDMKVPMLMANLALQVYQMARASGLSREDGAAVVKVYEQYAGVSLGTPS